MIIISAGALIFCALTYITILIGCGLYEYFEEKREDKLAEEERRKYD